MLVVPFDEVLLHGRQVSQLPAVARVHALEVSQRPVNLLGARSRVQLGRCQVEKLQVGTLIELHL